MQVELVSTSLVALLLRPHERRVFISRNRCFGGEQLMGTFATACSRKRPQQRFSYVEGP